MIINLKTDLTSEAVIRPHNGLKDQNTALRACRNIGNSGQVIIAITTTTGSSAAGSIEGRNLLLLLHERA